MWFESLRRRERAAEVGGGGARRCDSVHHAVLDFVRQPVPVDRYKQLLPSSQLGLSDCTLSWFRYQKQGNNEASGFEQIIQLHGQSSQYALRSYLRSDRSQRGVKSIALFLSLGFEAIVETRGRWKQTVRQAGCEEEPKTRTDEMSDHFVVTRLVPTHHSMKRSDRVCGLECCKRSRFLALALSNCSLQVPVQAVLEEAAGGSGRDGYCS